MAPTRRRTARRCSEPRPLSIIVHGLERQDLIEDLNEDGLSDPHNPTADDLPLILSRIQIIEEVVWDAMDEVNADAFLEAYKDLVNLAFQAMENG